MLAAHAQLKNVAVISIDDGFDHFGLTRIWQGVPPNLN
jgi:hypothetical protein